MNYEKKLRLNLILFRVKMFFWSLLFYMPIWYAFETRFATAETLAIIYAITHLIPVFLELPTGAIADLIGRKRVIALGLCIHGLSLIFLSQMQDVTWLWIGYIAVQIGNTLISGADTALFYDTLKELKENHLYSIYANQNELIYRVGLTLASIIGGYVYIVHFRLPYILVGISTLIAAGVTLFFTEPHIDSEKFTIRNYIQQTKLGFAQLWKNTYIRDFSLYYISVGGITWYYLYFLINAYMTDTGLLPIERGWIAAVNSMLVAVLGIIIAKKKLFTKTVAYLFFPISLMIGFFVAPFTTRWFSTISIFIIYLASIFRWTVLDQYTNAEFESKYRATAISALSMSTSVVYFLLSFLLAPILARYGSSWVMFSLGGITLLTTVPVTIVLLKNHRG